MDRGFHIIKTTHRLEQRPVKILCIVGKWAMVRSTYYPQAMPYVIRTKELKIVS